MKIIIFNNLYKPFARGGAEKFTEQLANGFIVDGHEVKIITSLPLGQKKPDNINVEYLRGYASLFYHLNKFPKILRLFYHLIGYIDPFVFYRTKKIVIDFEPNLIITNNLVGLGMVTARAIQNHGSKHIHVIHDIQLLHPTGLLLWGEENMIKTFVAKQYQRLNKLFFKRVDLVISPSEWLLDLHLRHSLFINAKTTVIANPVSLKDVQAPKTADSSLNNCLFVGQLEYHKGINFLLKTFDCLPDNFNLKIAGEGTLKDKVMKYSAANKHVKYLGKLTAEQVANEMRNSTVLIMPSLCYENSPTVIYEAMGAGLPVVAARLGGIPELIKDEDNLFTPGDQSSLVQKLTGRFNRYQKIPSDKMITAQQYVAQIIQKYKSL